jgi:CBS-domain-containing membrane protein
VSLREVARFSHDEVGYSRETLRRMQSQGLARHRPPVITCVERTTLVRDCLSLMLHDELTYVPVIDEHDLPIDVISMRDMMLFLARA